MAKRFNLTNAKPIYSPLPLGMDLSSPLSATRGEDSDQVAEVPYRVIIGSLMFTSIVSRPDITYSVNLLSKYLNNNGAIHWEAAKRVLHFVYTMQHQELMLGG